MSIVLSNLKMSDVEKKFAAISEKGNLKSVNGEIGYGLSILHVQGSGYYVDANGRKYFIVAHDGEYTDVDRRGFLFIFRESGEMSKPFVVVTPEGFNHPGGFQIIGDHLILPAENYSDGEDVDGGSRVVIYDLSYLAYDSAPLLCEPRLDITKHRAGMLGATKDWLAILDNSNLHLYKITELVEKEIKVKYYGKKKIKNYQGIGLIEQTEAVNGSNLFLIGLISDEDGSSFKDEIELKQIIPKDGNNPSFVVQDVDNTEKKHVSTDHGNGVGGIGGIHFRYGGGVHLYTDKNTNEVHMICLCTGRNIIKDDAEFNYNEFSSQERMEIICRQKPIRGQDNRVSQNFSLKGFTKPRIKFTVYKNNEPLSSQELTFQIYKDVPASADKEIYKNVHSGDVKFDSDDSPLYICSPQPSENAEIKIVIEGTDKPHNKE